MVRAPLFECNCYYCMGKWGGVGQGEGGGKRMRGLGVCEEFGIMIDFIDGIVGSHSIWKRALIHTRRSGCNRDNLNVRGGWERFKQMVDTYLDSDISY